MITKQIPVSSRFIECNTMVTGTFNTPTLGKYDFAIPANAGVFLANLKSGAVYVIDQVSFVANVAQDAYSSCVTPGDSPRMVIRRGVVTSPLYDRPIPLIAYTQGVDALAYADCAQKNDTLIVDFYGTITQGPLLVGVATISLTVGLRLYEVTEPTFVSLVRHQQRRK